MTHVGHNNAKIPLAWGDLRCWKSTLKSRKNSIQFNFFHSWVLFLSSSTQDEEEEIKLEINVLKKVSEGYAPLDFFLYFVCLFFRGAGMGLLLFLFFVFLIFASFGWHFVWVCLGFYAEVCVSFVLSLFSLKQIYCSCWVSYWSVVFCVFFFFSNCHVLAYFLSPFPLFNI